MAFYIKTTNQVCKKLGHGADRNDTADGNKLLWQADLNRVAGDTIFERAAAVGGVCLDTWEAKAEYDGCSNPAEVYTPEAYKDEDEVPMEEGTSKDETSSDQSVTVPPTTEETQPKQDQATEENPLEKGPSQEEKVNVEQTNEGGMK